MIQLVFALIFAASSWYAWRRNPMYSRRRTIHFLLATVLSIAALIAVFYSVVRLSQGRSENFQIAAILVAVLFCSIGLIWIIVSLTTPRPAPLPPGVTMSTLHRRRLIPWLKRTAWTLAGCVLLALFPSHADSFNWVQFAGLFIGAWVLGLGSILLATAYISGRNLDRALTAVLADPWVHWTYSPGEWTSFAEQQIAQAGAGEPKKYSNWIVFLVTGVPIAVGMYFEAVTPLWADLLIGLGFGALFVGILEFSKRQQLRAPDRLRARLNSAPHEAYLGPDGLFANGKYHPWISSGVYLVGATLDTATRSSISFRFEKVVGGPTGTITHFTEMVKFPSAMPPAELQAQLALLQQRLYEKVRTAKVFIA